MPDSTAMASLWPDPANRNQPFEQLLLDRRQESVEVERLLTNVRVNVERDVGPGVANIVVRGQRHMHFRSPRHGRRR